MLSANINSQLSLIGQNQARKKKLDDIVARKAAEDGSCHLCHRINYFDYFVIFCFKILRPESVEDAEPKSSFDKFGRSQNKYNIFAFENFGRRFHETT